MLGPLKKYEVKFILSFLITIFKIIFLFASTFKFLQKRYISWGKI